MVNKKGITPSLEDYLEAILRLEKKNRVARVKDIAKALNVQMPSVTGAIKNLKQKELINYEKNSFISLKEKGMKIACSVENRHNALKDFLSKIVLIQDKEADEQACKMEHNISTETAERIKNITSYIENTIFKDKNLSKTEWENIITKHLKN